MNELLVLKLLDYIIKPKQWYAYSDLVVEGYRIIATKDDQNNAGLPEAVAGSLSSVKQRRFGMSPIKPYRDYYGSFKLKTKLLAGEDQELEIKFAIGYTINNRVTTIDDYSNFGWLRLAQARQGILYPNLSDQKQLLQYLLQHSKYPKFVTTRVYHYFQLDIQNKLTALILEREL